MGGRPKNGTADPRIDFKRAVTLALQGNTYADIARIFGVGKQAAHTALQPIMKLIGEPAQLRAYQHNKADILEGIQAQLARSLLDPDKIRKANMGNVAYAMRQLNDMLRLERGESTANVAVAHAEAVRTLQEVDAEIVSITESLPQSTESAEDYKEDPALRKLDDQVKLITSQGLDIIDDPADKPRRGRPKKLVNLSN